MHVADANPLLTFSAASTWSLPAEAATCVVSVQFDEDASLDAEFASGEFGSGESGSGGEGLPLEVQLPWYTPPTVHGVKKALVDARYTTNDIKLNFSQPQCQ